MGDLGVIIFCLVVIVTSTYIQPKYIWMIVEVIYSVAIFIVLFLLSAVILFGRIRGQNTLFGYFCWMCIGFVKAISSLLWKLYTSKPDHIQVVFGWAEPSCVGETSSFRVFIVSKTLSLTAQKKILEELDIEIKHTRPHGDRDAKIQFIKEFVNTPNETAVVIKFVVRTSGDYQIQIFSALRHVPGSPFIKNFLPCDLDVETTELIRPCSTIVCTTFEETIWQIRPKDKFENICRVNEVEKLLFNFDVNYVDGLVLNPKTISQTCTHHFSTTNNGLFLLPTFKRPGFFRGEITYKRQLIQYGTFDIVSLSNDEVVALDRILHKDPSWVYHESRLLVLGTVHQKGQKVYIYVGPKQLHVRDYLLKYIPLRVATFRVSAMTKIEIMLTNNSSKTHTLSISDSTQPKVVVEMDSVVARRVVAIFSHFLKQRLGGSEFIAKKTYFYGEVRSLQKEMRLSLTVLKINRNDIINSTLSLTRHFREDWYKNFKIEFDGELGVDVGGLRREWLDILCVKLFGHNPNGLFSSLGNSRLVHPNPIEKRSTYWNLKHYELAGKIVGKCLFESAIGGTCKQMVNGRFTRSFLAQVLGLRPNYKHFEQDEPELYLGKIKYILDNDVKPMDLTFSEEEYDDYGKLTKVVNLIPNGSKVKVTEDNKVDYLQQLANYKLGTKVEKEVQAFVRGLHEIIPDELLTNFDENELEVLWCGKSQFNVEDLKKNFSRGFWTFDQGTNRILEWFFMCISAFSDDEKARLLQFTTGSSLLPHGGFKALDPQFKISISASFGHLPTAHTCFNEIVLSDNSTFKDFKKCLKIAINEGSQGFGFR